MSTRCQVILNNRQDIEHTDSEKKITWTNKELDVLIKESCILYHHWDWYPEYMIPLIFDVLNLPHGRLTDIEYLNAIMLWYWKHTENDLTTKILSNPDKWWDDDIYRQLWLSHWVSNEIHWDIAYMYLVHAQSKTVHVLEYDYDNEYWIVSASYNSENP